jgi:hypothetical protein
MKNFPIIILVFTFCTTVFVSCKLNVPITQIDQTVIVQTPDGSALAGKTVKLTGSSLHLNMSETAVTDADGKAHFNFGWEEYHESGNNNWYIDALPNNNIIAINRIRDRFQRSSIMNNSNIIVMDSLVPFKIHFKTKSRIHEFSYFLSSEIAGDKFFTVDKVKIAPQFIDTIITVKAFKQSPFRIEMNFFYSDKANPLNSNPRGFEVGNVPKNFSRDSAFLVFNLWE